MAIGGLISAILSWIPYLSVYRGIEFFSNPRSYMRPEDRHHRPPRAGGSPTDLAASFQRKKQGAPAGAPVPDNNGV